MIDLLFRFYRNRFGYNSWLGPSLWSDIHNFQNR